MTAERSAGGESRAPRSPSRPPLGLSRPVVATIAFALASGFLVTSALLTGREAAEARRSRHGELVAVIEARQEHVDGLETQLEQLRARVAEVEGAADADGLSRDVREIERVAGLTPLAGPGVRLRLDDGDGPCPTGEPADCRIRDRDVQAAVNALFAGGAEAVAVDDERVVATTAIRNAGSSILVNYRVLGPPYEIAAIGDPTTLRTEVTHSGFGRDFAVWTDRYGLGYDLDGDDDVRLPAYAGSVRTRAAGIGPADASASPQGPASEPDRVDAGQPAGRDAGPAPSRREPRP